MSNLLKLYHRGNDDVGEGVRLTAIFKLTLTADTSTCAQSIGNEEEVLFDFIGGGEEYVARKISVLPQKAREVIGLVTRATDDASALKMNRRVVSDSPVLWEGVFLAVNQGKCVGDVSVSLDVDIQSPEGRGNGEAQAGPIAARFGLEHNGAFTPFNGGPTAPKSEHWKADQSLDLGTVPCAGGVLQGSLKINSGAGIAPSYTIKYKVTVTSCGVDALELELVAEARPGIGPGGIAIPPLAEVKEAGALPYPLKNPPANPVVVGANGQPRPA